MSTYNVEDVIKNIFDHEDPNWKPSDKIPLIIKEIESQKNELKTVLVNSDYDIESLIKDSDELSSESNLLVQDLEKCKKEIEEETMAEIVKSIENYDALSKELQCVTFAAELVGDVIQCGRYVKEFDEGREAQSFTKSVEAVCDLVLYIERPLDGFDNLDIAGKTRDIAQLILDNLVDELNTEWTRSLNWSIKASPRKTVVVINVNFDESVFCLDMIHALETCRKLPDRIKEFSEFLLKDVLRPILYSDCAVVVERDNMVVLTVTHKKNYKPTYIDVIENYRTLFMFLTNRLNYDIRRGVTLMTKVGREIRSEFSKLLMKDCFIDTIPNNIIDLQTYGRITAQLQDFQNFLIQIQFFPDDDSISVLSYIENIDVLFAERASKHLLASARTIMLKDLSLSMSIGVENVPEEDSPIIPEYEEAMKMLDKLLPKSLFYFPRCMISKSAQELLDLLYMLMEQAVQCPDVVCKKLYNTARLIFELYDAVVPYHHENYLQTIPQYVALFHNNCMFLAHNMLTFGDKWMVLLEGRTIDYPISFLDLVQKLRELGYSHLTAHMQQQRKQILDNIRSSDLNCIVVKDVLGDNAEAAIRQCLRQLHLLKNVWIGVFPPNVFTGLMTTLVDMFISELIHRVCTVEDISMEMATQLTEMYSLVVQKAPQLFQNPKDVEKHVKSWIKLQELIFVLGGSLKDIENHWDEGKGPLAIHFRTEELRSLIKALFQNTQIRANLLSKIK